MTLEEEYDLLYAYVEINYDEKIEVDSRLGKLIDPGRLQDLLDIIDDNICTEELGNGYASDYIDWENVAKDILNLENNP